MPKSAREIKGRIRSVKNIGQITKAMEMVSAAKMRKAQAATQASRPYARLSAELLQNLIGKVGPQAHPLLKRVMPERYGGQAIRPQHKALIILLTSDKGLAGSLNSNVITQAASIAKQEGAAGYDFIAVGKKGAEALRRHGHKVIAMFGAKDRAIRVFDAQPITEIAVAEFLNFTYDAVYVVYTDFISTLVQKPKTLRILPLAETEPMHNMEDFLFEPDASMVMGKVVERYVEFAVYQCLQEAAASEHSARMVAMKNANQAAKDLIDELTLSANQARQAGITRELSEISAAKIAMED